MDPIDIERTGIAPISPRPKHAEGSLIPGQGFGQYRVVRMLGRGGMGEVYEVEHVTLSKRFAIKLLPADFAARPDALERFRQEAKVTANLEHPNIVRVDDFGETNGRYWLRMELVQGVEIDAGGGTTDRAVSLQELAAAYGGKLPQAMLLRVLTHVAMGLDYAHRRGVVHRDLKPGNILIETGQTEGADESECDWLTAKIADFGLVRLIGEEWLRNRAELSVKQSMSVGDMRTMAGPGDSEGSSTRSLLGTYEYMSPEQKRGSDVDARSDIYALGLMTYRLLTGRNLGLKSPSQIDPSLSPAWDELVASATEEQINERMPSAGAFFVALKKVAEDLKQRPTDAAGVPALPRGQSATASSGPVGKKKTGLIIGLVIGIVFAAAALTIGLIRTSRSMRETSSSGVTTVAQISTTSIAPPAERTATKSATLVPPKSNPPAELKALPEKIEFDEPAAVKATPAPTQTAGLIGKALCLNGKGGYVNIPHRTLLSTASYTVMAWINTTDAGVGRRRIISQQGHAFGNWVLALNNNQMEFGCATANVLEPHGPTLNDGAWHMVAGVRDAANKVLRWNVDGVDVFTFPSAATEVDVIADQDVYIGKVFNNPEYFSGAIDEVRIFNTPLTAKTLHGLYTNTMALSANGAPASPSGPKGEVLHYTFDNDDPVSGTVHDDSPNRNDGNLHPPFSYTEPAVAKRSSSQQDLQACWPFDGDAEDTSGHGNFGKLHNVTAVPDRFENASGALRFDGKSAFIEIPNAPSLDLVDDFSISLWLNVPADAHQNSILVSKHANGANQDGSWHIMLNKSAEEARLLVGPPFAATAEAAIRSAPLALSGWTHVVIAYDHTKAECRFYCNGVLNQTDRQALTPGRNSWNLMVGGEHLPVGIANQESRADLHTLFQGDMDDLRILSKALSAEEVRAIFNAGNASREAAVITPDMLTKGLVACWPFDGNAKDVSGNGHDGTPHNVAVAPDRFGTPKKACRFNGKTSYIEVPHSDALCLTSDFSIALWLKLPSSSSQYHVLSKHTFGRDNDGSWLLAYGYDGKSAGIYFNPPCGIPTEMPRTAAFDIAGWKHFVLTYDSKRKDWKTYLDGKLSLSGNCALLFSRTEFPFLIGGTSRGTGLDTASMFGGDMDDLRIYNRVLSEQEADALFRTEDASITNPLNTNGSWRLLKMDSRRAWCTSTLLHDGTVLVAGGYGANGDDHLASCSIFDPATETSRPTGSFHSPRHLFTATLLNDGRVLVVGGYNRSSQWLADAEIYDPVTGQWKVVPPKFKHGILHRATLLPDGRVFVLGGAIGSGQHSGQAETFDPLTDTWTPSRQKFVPRASFASLVLPDGKIFIASGGGSAEAVASALIYDPITDTAQSLPNLPSTIEYDSCLLLPDQRILLFDVMGNISDCLVGDPKSGSWSRAASLSGPRALCAKLSLSNGSALLAGGSAVGQTGSPLDTAEYFDLAKQSWIAFPRMNQARCQVHSIVRLRDGRIAIFGGSDGHAGLDTCEIYTSGPVAKAETATGPTSFDIGTVWEETEGTYSGVWVRRQNSNFFDATWTRGSEVVRGVIEFKSYNAGIVTLIRDGHQVYRGYLAPDGLTIARGQLDNSAESWSAVIQTGGAMRTRPPLVPSEDLLLHYGFYKQSTSTVEDLSGNNHAGSIHGPKWISYGASRGAYEFDGDDDYVDINSGNDISRSIGTGDFTVSVWLETKKQKHLTGYILEQHTQGAPWTGIYLNVDTQASKVRFRVSESGSSASCVAFDSGKIEGDGKIHCIMALRQGGVLRLYLDGHLEDEKKAPLTSLDARFAAGLRIGTHSEQVGRDMDFRGIIYQLTIHKRALSDAEIKRMSKLQA